jgi:chromosome segregation ATPase
MASLSRGSGGSSGGRQGKLESTVNALKDVINRQRREIDGMIGKSGVMGSGASSSLIQSGRELAAARAKVKSLEVKVAALGTQVSDLHELLADKQAQVDTAVAARRTAQERASRSDASRTAGGQGGDMESLQESVRKLGSENDALRSELAGLDMGFFEEVEDMKHQLALAQRKAHAFDQYMASSGQQPAVASTGGMQFSGVGDPAAATRRAYM